jgi:hypothetical protein
MAILAVSCWSQSAPIASEAENRAALYGSSPGAKLNDLNYAAVSEPFRSTAVVRRNKGQSG